DRQQAVEREREHGRQEAERRERDAEYALAERCEAEQQRVKQREQREPGDRLHDARERERDRAKGRAPERRQRERHTQRDAERERREADPDVAAEVVGQAGERLGETRLEVAHVPGPFASRPVISALRRSAWRRGVCISSRTSGAVSPPLRAPARPSALP